MIIVKFHPDEQLLHHPNETNETGINKWNNNRKKGFDF